MRQMQCVRSSAILLFLSERYEHKSVILTTNLVFSEWNRIFKDPMTTMAAIDRVVHHSVILDMMGVESYRAKEANHQHVLLQQNTQEAASQLINNQNKRMIRIAPR